MERPDARDQRARRMVAVPNHRLPATRILRLGVPGHPVVDLGQWSQSRYWRGLTKEQLLRRMLERRCELNLAPPEESEKLAPASQPAGRP